MERGMISCEYVCLVGLVWFWEMQGWWGGFFWSWLLLGCSLVEVPSSCVTVLGCELPRQW